MQFIKPETNTVTMDELAIMIAKGFKETSTDIAKLDTRLTSVENTVTEIKTDLTVVKSDIVSIKSDITTMKSDIVGVKSDITTIKSDMATKDDIQDIKAISTDHNRRIRRIETKLQIA